MNKKSCWVVVVLYAMAMAWVEAAVVFYLRTMIHRVEPYQPNPLPVVGGLGLVEMVREAATLLMLLTVGVLAGRNWPSRLGYSAVAFGFWDIGYYVFLKLMCDWPHSFLDWDILFLIPLPWWGPVFAPVAISVLMILWGTLASQSEPLKTRVAWRSWTLNALGILLALYLFMADGLRSAHGGVDALRQLLPTHFNWPLFGLALLLMAAPIVRLLQQRRVSRMAMILEPEEPGTAGMPGSANRSAL